MQVSLPPDIEAIAEQAVRSGNYGSVSDFVVESIRKNAGDAAANSVGDLPYEQWQKRFRDYLNNRSQTAGATLDDSRESMYPDRS